MNNPFGIYIHVPFCKSKCAYCDFYSYRADDAAYDLYAKTLIRHITAAGASLKARADTLYFGGGTPSVLGGERIAEITKTAKNVFGLDGGEITLEVNPATFSEDDFARVRSSGVNRISVGVQSADDGELKALSRIHTAEDAKSAVLRAKNAGIDNISVDVMLGIPWQTTESLKKTLDFVIGLKPQHISCYMLKIEPQTPFGKTDPDKLYLPDEDTVADFYLYTSEFLRNYGFEHYEISNFALPGFRSRHNMKYWTCGEYLGFGPSAHSFLNGKRFFFERDAAKYISAPAPVSDGTGGGLAEYVMLGLRLSDGVSLNQVQALYGAKARRMLLCKAEPLRKTGLIRIGDTLSLTEKGFLVSNAVIAELL